MVEEKRVLSADIRAGIALDGEQHFGTYYGIDPEGYIVASCALGAAAIGAGLVRVGVAHTVRDEDENGEPIDVPAAPVPDLSAIYFDAYLYKVACPVSSEPHSGYGEFGPPPPAAYDLVPHLNDEHRWTREQIADWLEGLGL